MKVDNPNFAGASFHHLGVACKDIDEALGYLRHLLPAQFEESDTIRTPAILFEGRHVQFFQSSLGLVELLESE